MRIMIDKYKQWLKYAWLDLYQCHIIILKPGTKSQVFPKNLGNTENGWNDH